MIVILCVVYVFDYSFVYGCIFVEWFNLCLIRFTSIDLLFIVWLLVDYNCVHSTEGFDTIPQSYDSGYEISYEPCRRCYEPERGVFGLMREECGAQSLFYRRTTSNLREASWAPCSVPSLKRTFCSGSCALTFILYLLRERPHLFLVYNTLYCPCAYILYIH